MHSILRNITLSISLLRCVFYVLLDSQHIFCTFILRQEIFCPRRITSPLLHIELPHLQHLYLGYHFASLLVFVRVDFHHELPSCTHVFMVPHWAFTVWQHHQVALV